MEHTYKKIKELRIAQGMTLKEMSKKTGLSISFLSQIERGTSSLAITSLKKIADTLQEPMISFFDETDVHSYAVKKEEQKQFQIEGNESKYVRLSGDFYGRKLEPMIVTLQPKQNGGEVFSHPGEEFYYVVKGAVVFTVEQQEFILTEGESIHFPSDKAHSWKNPLEQESVLLSILTPVIF